MQIIFKLISKAVEGLGPSDKIMYYYMIFYQTWYISSICIL